MGYGGLLPLLLTVQTVLLMVLWKHRQSISDSISDACKGLEQ